MSRRLLTAIAPKSWPPATLGLLLFFTTLAAACSLFVAHRPVAFLGGLSDEWLTLGCNLAANRTLGWGAEPMVLRPPGYPAFVAAVLLSATHVPPLLSAEFLRSAMELVCLSQAVLLAATTALLFHWLRRRVRLGVAFTAALLYGTNPYSLILVGLMRYDVLHLFLLVAGCVALDAALGRDGRNWPLLLATGALWGLTTLVRPVSLLLPPFLLLAFLARGLRPRRALVALAVFVLGMAIAISPWTARNFRVTGRLLAVNAQAWAAIWGSTQEKLRMDPNEYQWRGLGVAHYRRIAGEDYDYFSYIRKTEAFEAVFREAALQNLRSQPLVYVHNVLRGVLTVNLQINTSLVSVFQRIQRTGEIVSQAWFWAGAEHERRETRSSRALGLLVNALTLLGGYGVVAACARRDAFLWIPAAVYLCISLAHALTYMDLMYYYIKLPFLAVFAALGLEALYERGLALGSEARRIPVATALAAVLVMLCLAPTLAIVFGP